MFAVRRIHGRLDIILQLHEALQEDMEAYLGEAQPETEAEQGYASSIRARCPATEASAESRVSSGAPSLSASARYAASYAVRLLRSCHMRSSSG